MTLRELCNIDLSVNDAQSKLPNSEDTVRYEVIETHGDAATRSDGAVTAHTNESRTEKSDGALQSPSYRDVKLRALHYQNSKAVLLGRPPFCHWLESPQHLQNFTLPLSDM